MGAVRSLGRPTPTRPSRSRKRCWGSWAEDAWTRDVTTARFADSNKVQAINLKGQYVASRGPFPIPPSEQGQPVIFSAGGGAYVLELARRYPSGVIGAVFTICADRIIGPPPAKWVAGRLLSRRLAARVQSGVRPMDEVADRLSWPSGRYFL